jgi:hypothetical protein
MFSQEMHKNTLKLIRVKAGTIKLNRLSQKFQFTLQLGTYSAMKTNEKQKKIILAEALQNDSILGTKHERARLHFSKVLRVGSQ